MPGLLLRNARIWTGDAAQPWAGAALVREGRFAFAGSENEIEPPADVEVLDLGGRLAVPGFIDGHVHLLSTGVALRSVDLKGVRSVEEAARRVAARTVVTPANGWVRGAGWDQHLWPGARFPTKDELDAVAPEHPVVLTHTSGHCIWVNSAALSEAGVTSATEAPPGGVIDYDADGEPSGILRDAASRLVERVAPRASHEERCAILRETIAHAHSLGVTSVHAMDVGRGELEALRALHEARELSLRVRMFLTASRLDDWAGSERTGSGDDVLRTDGVKFFTDGALGSMTAWMLEPYEGSSETGLAIQPVEELERMVRLALDHGLAPAVHAIGDRANREALDIFDRVRAIAPELPRRVEHAQLLTAENLGRFAQLGVTVSAQPIHATQDMANVDRVWGKRGRYAYPFASLLARGTHVAFGSDTPVETMDPIAGLHAAVTRRNARGEPEDGWCPDERITLDDALTAYTSGCARAVGEDSSLGRIASGQHADVAVLSHNVFALRDPHEIRNARVVMTIAGGNVVFQSEGV